ncbi:MAG: endonuclease/exonuclease/phosphatase family protein [Planctomycetota bacterium]|jgi:endonuclease/exonuclease/phosphatase family metal-dependent hydrolase
MVRVATFNVENLFARYRFRANFTPSLDDGFTRNDLAFQIHDNDAKRITARAIRAVNADVLCIQEVESLGVLEGFNSRYLGQMRYPHRMLIDSHDPRYIDVAVLSRYPLEFVKSHRDRRNSANTTWLFSRDCLEIDVDVNGDLLSLYVNHFKSMMGGRQQTRERRLEQATAVRDIVNDWWRSADFSGNFIVAGDLNDYPGTGTALGPLLNHPQLVNVVNRLPANQRWTHYWAGGDEYRQLDYLLLSRALADQNPGRPVIERHGLPWRATRYTGQRFEDVGEREPKASDHCPLYMDIDLI